MSKTDSVFVEIGELQSKYKNLSAKNKMTKQALCDLCVPFKDKYSLSDIQTLQIVRGNLSISEIAKVLKLK